MILANWWCENRDRPALLRMHRGRGIELLRRHRLTNIGVQATQSLRRDSRQIQQSDRPHPHHSAQDAAATPSPCRGDHFASQARDAARTFEAAREIEILANWHIGKTAQRFEGFAAHEDRLVPGGGAAEAGSDANQTRRSERTADDRHRGEGRSGRQSPMDPRARSRYRAQTSEAQSCRRATNANASPDARAAPAFI